MATNKSLTSYLIMLFRKKVKLFSLFISVLYSFNLSAQPLNFSIEKVKSFDLRSVDANYDFRVNSLESQDAFSKQSFLNDLKKKAELKLGKGKYESTRYLKTMSDSPILIDELGMKRVFTVNGAQIPLAGGTPNDNTVAFSKDSILLGAVNSILWAWDLKTDTFHFPQQFISLIQASGVVTSSGASDPRLLYDPNEDRWVLLFFVGNTPQTSKIVVCFSQTNDPAAGWHMYTLPGNPLNNNRWSDFPSIALSDDKLIMSINLIIPGVSWQLGFDGTVIWEMDKFSGFSGSSVLPSELHHGIKYNGKFIRNLVAVNGWNGYVSKPMFASNRNFSIQNDSTFFLSRVDSAIGGTHSYNISMCPSSIPYGVPPNGKQPIVSASNTYDLSTNDGRWLGALETPTGQVHLVSTTRDFTTNRCALYHGIYRTNDQPDSLVGNIISHSSRDLAYPNIVFLGNEECDTEVLIGFNHSSISEYAGYSAIYYSNDGSYSDIITLKEGEGVVNKLSGPERWGDYFGLQTVYHDPQKAWSSGFYGLSNGGNSSWFSLLQSPDSTALDFEITLSGMGCNHLIEVDVFGGIEPFEFFWDGNKGFSNYSGACSGDSVTFELIDSRGCSNKTNLYIPYANAPAPSIFPNPSLGNLTFAVDAPYSGYLFLRLVNSAGEIIQMGVREINLGRNEVYLWLGNIPSGQYLAQAIFSKESSEIIDGDNIIAEKFILLRE